MEPSDRTSLTDKLVSELSLSLELTESTPPDRYLRCTSGQGSIGAHIRHILDVVNVLLNGFETGSIDYSNRNRDLLIERDPITAGRELRSAIKRLKRMDKVDQNSLLNLRSEVSPCMVHVTTLSRELEFVFSHTVHHHALIKERLTAHGVRSSRHLGVAPSTQEYRDRLQHAA